MHTKRFHASFLESLKKVTTSNYILTKKSRKQGNTRTEMEVDGRGEKGEKETKEEERGMEEK